MNIHAVEAMVHQRQPLALIFDADVIKERVFIVPQFHQGKKDPPHPITSIIRHDPSNIQPLSTTLCGKKAFNHLAPVTMLHPVNDNRYHDEQRSQQGCPIQKKQRRQRKKSRGSRSLSLRLLLVMGGCFFCIWSTSFCQAQTCERKSSDDGDDDKATVTKGWKARFQNLVGKVKARLLGHQSSPATKASAVTVEENFISNENAALLLERYKPLLRESLHKTTSGPAQRNEYRTSHTVRLPPLGDALVFQVEAQAAATVHAAATYCEDLQLACYGQDELYALHRDDNAQGAAGRMATILIYLQAPDEGGATLFTHRPIEDERYQGKPLRTNANAIQLFREYCAGQHQRLRPTAVEAVTGRAVVWYNYNTTTGVFAQDSTHGACPVIAGEKCVVQQWIARPTVGPNPLRNVTALFTSGAAQSFREEMAKADRPALTDASPHLGSHVSRLVPAQGMDLDLLPNDGPYTNIGALRIKGSGGLSASWSTLSLERSFSVSFWVRNVLPGTVLLSVQEGQVPDNFSVFSVLASAVSRNDGSVPTPVVLEFMQHLPSDTTATESHLFSRSFSLPETEWMWLTFAYDASASPASIRCTMFSVDGDMLGDERFDIPFTHATEMDDTRDKGHGLNLVLLSLPNRNDSENDEATTEPPKESAAFVNAPSGSEPVAFLQKERKTLSESLMDGHIDISFIAFHDSVLPQDVARDLRVQIRRYDINL